MNYEIVTLKEQLIVGKSIITTNEKGQSMHDIGTMWQQFMSGDTYSSIKNKTSQRVMGLYTDYEGDQAMPYRFMCCTEVSKNENPELENRTIISGKYAKFTIKGDLVESVGQAWQKIWSMELDRKYSFDFELYHNDSDDMSNQTIDIYIALNER